MHSREESALVCQKGDPLPVNVSVSRIHTKPEALGLVMARDVSERHRARQVLEHQPTQVTRASRVPAKQAARSRGARPLNVEARSIRPGLTSAWWKARQSVIRRSNRRCQAEW